MFIFYNLSGKIMYLKNVSTTAFFFLKITMKMTIHVLDIQFFFIHASIALSTLVQTEMSQQPLDG